jgi:glycosyltransferase involved in cell wall biosynthesis
MPTKDMTDRDTTVETKQAESPTTRAPLFSVVIPLFNHERYIREAVDSVLNQTVSDFELIIINDGSTDGSEAVVRQIQDSRIQYFFQENRGAHETINRGIRLARGKYIGILNSDDLFLPDRLETAAGVMESDLELQAVFSHLEVVDGDGETTGWINGAEDNWKERDDTVSFRDKNNIVLDLLSGNFLTTTTNLFCRRSVFEEVGYFRGFKYVHDYDFFLRLCHECKTCVIPKPLVKYRRHRSNTINENLPETYFEVGMVLSDFFLSHDLDDIMPDGDVRTDIVEFFNSVKTYNSDRIIMTLLLFGLKGGKAGGLVENLAFDKSAEAPFKKSCMAYHHKRIDEWNESQEAWKTVSELNERLLETKERLAKEHKEASDNWLEAQRAWKKWAEVDETLAETQNSLNETKSELFATNNRLSAAEYHLQLVLNSKSYRLGRALTWPLRKLAGKIEAMRKQG